MKTQVAPRKNPRLRLQIAAIAVVGMLLFLFPNGARANSDSSVEVVLMQSDSVVRSRVLDMDGLVAFLKKAKTTAFDIERKSKNPHPASGYIILALRNGKAHPSAWCDFDASDDPVFIRQIETAMREISAPEVEGTVVVALKISFFGAPAAFKKIPYPRPWREAIEHLGKTLDAASVAELLWQQ